jgi:hypothetical protein
MASSVGVSSRYHTRGIILSPPRRGGGIPGLSPPLANCPVSLPGVSPWTVSLINFLFPRPCWRHPRGRDCSDAAQDDHDMVDREPGCPLFCGYNKLSVVYIYTTIYTCRSRRHLLPPSSVGSLPGKPTSRSPLPRYNRSPHDDELNFAEFIIKVLCHGGPVTRYHMPGQFIIFK